MKTKLISNSMYLLLIDEEAEVCRGQYRFLNNKVELIHEGHNYPYKGEKIIAYYPLTEEAEVLDLPLLPPFEENYETVYVLLADGDGTMRSIDEPFGVAVKTKEAAEDYVKNGGVGYSHSYEKLRIFDNAKEGIDWRYKGINPKAQSKQFTLDDIKKAIEMASTLVDLQGCYFSTSYLKNLESDELANLIKPKYSEEEIIQSRSTQQLPKEFIHEYIYDPTSCLCDKKPCKCRMKVFKTITNSEGKEVLVGTYR